MHVLNKMGHKFHSVAKLWGVALTTTAFLVACGGGGGSSTPPPTTPPPANHKIRGLSIDRLKPEMQKDIREIAQIVLESNGLVRESLTGTVSRSA